VRTFIPPLKKQVEEKIEIRIDASVAGMLRDYAEFLDSPQGYVVTEVLRRVFRKDKAFVQWGATRESAPVPSTRARRTKARPQDESVSAAGL
jgi:hypothetical protein